VDDEWGAVFRKNIFKEAVEKNISVHFLHHFTLIPGRRSNKTVIRSLISTVEEVVTESVLQATQRLDALDNICHCDPLAQILKQLIAE